MFEIFQYDFMQNALIAGALIGLLLPTIGVIVMLRRLTFLADSLGHINMAGISFYIYISAIFPIFLGFQIGIILLWSIISAVLIEYLRDKYKNYKELSIMIIYSISIALTMIFLSLSTGYNSSVFNLLFGNINAVSRSDIWQILVIEMIIFIIYLKPYKKIRLFSLDLKKTAKIHIF